MQLASMGPRLISRGVTDDHGSDRGAPGASMGPRLISRGVVTSGVMRYEPSRLQWGRGSLAAACFQRWTRHRWTLMLQWGRGSLAAACQGRARDAALSSGFNGAAAH